jgi:serine protease
LIVNPLTLNFGNSSEGKTLTVSKSNDNPLTDIDVTDDADWLTVTAELVDGEGLGTYLVTVNRNGLQDGPYYGTITFESSENDVDLSVTMYKGAVAVTGDAGFHYVLLIDADNYLARYQDEVFTTNGSYVYNFPSVAEGEYIVFAGTDSDNDLYIGDAGESSGAYISLDQPKIIRVNKNLGGIDFSTSFNIDLPTGLSSDTVKHEPGVRKMGTQ